jgi:hypothetical protein
MDGGIEAKRLVFAADSPASPQSGHDWLAETWTGVMLHPFLKGE